MVPGPQALRLVPGLEGLGFRGLGVWGLGGLEGLAKWEFPKIRVPYLGSFE